MRKECERTLIVDAVTVLCVGIFLSGCVTTQGSLSLPYQGTVSTTGGAFTVVNTGSGDGIFGATEGIAGVRGRANPTGDFANYGGHFYAGGQKGEGIHGEASGSSAIGVSGWASNQGARNYGGYFKADGKAGIGLYGVVGGEHGLAVVGFAAGENGRGITGEASNSADVTNYGGHFVARGKYGRGIYARGGPDGYAAEFDGTVTTRVLQITGGSDLSEKFEVRKERDIPPTSGMVVSIDPENPGKLVISNEAYDRRIAGIISGAGNIQSGMMMGQANSAADGEHPVALIGRVYCLADSSNGSIEPGDLLTTSDIPGHAMKVTDHIRAQGAVLGKAMTRLESGQGLVLVLVNLQ